MKKNTISALFLSFLISSSLMSCSGTSTSTEGTADSTAIETPVAETATNPAFEKLLAEFETCNDLEKFFKNDSNDACVTAKEYKEEEAKAKIESLSSQIFALTDKKSALNDFGRETFLEEAFTYDIIEDLSKFSQEDLVFLSFTVRMGYVNTTSVILVFSKTGEFKSAFTNYFDSSGSQVSSSTSISSVEKGESLKLMINSIEEGKDGTANETGGDFYLIAKDGTVTYDDSQKK